MIKEDSAGPSILIGARRVLHGLPKMASGIIGLGGFAYFIGWAYARSYYSVFGASWLCSEISVQTLLGYSWWPVVIILFFAYLGVTDLATTESEGMIEVSSRFKMTRLILNYGRWVFITTGFAAIILGSLGYPNIARLLSMASIVMVVAMATSAVEMLVVRLSHPDLKINLSVVSLTYIIIVFGLYFAPTQMGRNAALQDQNLELSALPVVTLRDDSLNEYRMLNSFGDRYYIFPAKYEGRYPPIKIATTSQIQTIQTRLKKEHSK